MKRQPISRSQDYHKSQTSAKSMSTQEIIDLHNNAIKITDPSSSNPYAERLDILADIMARPTMRELITLSGQEDQRAQARIILRGYGSTRD